MNISTDSPATTSPLDRPDDPTALFSFRTAKLPPDCVIAANGDADPRDLRAMRAAVQRGAILIAADGGLRYCLQSGCRPDLIIGDMDSVDSNSLAQMAASGVQIARYPAEKDETDLELALLAAADRNAQRIVIFAGNGDRLDQTMGNLFLLGLPALRGRSVFLRAGKQSSTLLYPGQSTLLGATDDTISLLPLNGDAVGISTHGLKYRLQNETLRFGPARGISNVMLEAQVTITLASGLLLVVHTEGRA